MEVTNLRSCPRPSARFHRPQPCRIMPAHTFLTFFVCNFVTFLHRFWHVLQQFHFVLNIFDTVSFIRNIINDIDNIPCNIFDIANIFVVIQLLESSHICMWSGYWIMFCHILDKNFSSISSITNSMSSSITCWSSRSLAGPLLTALLVPLPLHMHPGLIL